MNIKPSVEPYAVLEMFRRGYRSLPDRGGITAPCHQGFATAANIYMRRLEDRSHPDELWSTPGLNEDKLLPHMRIGEHIAITRRIMGLTP
jgi:hypothetical protein